MLICHCNRMSDKQILEIAQRLREEKPDQPLRSNLIYRGHGCRAKCGCCRPMIEALLLAKGYDVSVAKRDEIDRLRERRFYTSENERPNVS